MTGWKQKLDHVIKEHLDAQLRKSYDHEDAFGSAANKANAQLWVAIANLSKEIFDLNLKIKYLEEAKKKVKKRKTIKKSKR